MGGSKLTVRVLEVEDEGGVQRRDREAATDLTADEGEPAADKETA